MTAFNNLTQFMYSDGSDYSPFVARLNYILELYASMLWNVKLFFSAFEIPIETKRAWKSHKMK